MVIEANFCPRGGKVLYVSSFGSRSLILGRVYMSIVDDLEPYSIQGELELGSWIMR